jgi:hypothetical protein
MIDMEDPSQVVRMVLSAVFSDILLARGSLSPSPLLAQVSVELADALIVALDKPPPPP